MQSKNWQDAAYLKLNQEVVTDKVASISPKIIDSGQSSIIRLPENKLYQQMKVFMLHLSLFVCVNESEWREGSLSKDVAQLRKSDAGKIAAL